LIIRRYLVKQVVSTSLVVIALLTLIMMGGRLIKYFGVAAQGRLDAGILFSIIGYRLPVGSKSTCAVFSKIQRPSCTN
jgi:lipopolysaccharide export system permease protein